MFFGPALEHFFEIGASFDCFLHGFIVIFVEVVLDSVGGNHEIQDNSLVVQAFYGVTDDILDIFPIRMNYFIFYIPASLPNQVSQKNNFYLVKKEYSAHCL